MFILYSTEMTIIFVSLNKSLDRQRFSFLYKETSDEGRDM